MPRTELTVQEINRAGIDPAYSAADATNDHSFDNTTQEVFVHIINGGVGAINATFITSKVIDGISVGDLVINIPASEDRMVGPFRNDLYGSEDEPNGLTKAVLIDLDGDTSVTLAALALGDVNY